MKNLIQTFLILTSLVLNHSYASTVTESTDFPNGSSFGAFAVSIGVLEVGTNTVFGSLAGECSIDFGCGDGVDGQDSFLIEIGNGFQLDNIFVTTSNISGPASLSASFSLRDESNSISIFEPYLPLGSTTLNLVSGVLESGIYSVSMFGQQASEAGLYSLDYSIEFGVTAVPVPAAVWLFSSGLIGLIGMRKRSVKLSGKYA